MVEYRFNKHTREHALKIILRLALDEVAMRDCLVSSGTRNALTSLVGYSENRETDLTVSDSCLLFPRFLRLETGLWNSNVSVQDCSGRDDTKPTFEAPATDHSEDGLFKTPPGAGILPSGHLTS